MVCRCDFHCLIGMVADTGYANSERTDPPTGESTEDSTKMLGGLLIAPELR